MKKLVFILTCLFLFQLNYADEIKITTSAPNKIGVGQRFEVKYTITDKKGSNPKISDQSNFNFAGGPYSSTMSNMSMIGNSFSQQTSYSYSYYFEAKSTGKINLPIFSITIDGKTYSSTVTSIEVQKDPIQNNNRSSRSRLYDPWDEFEEAVGGGQSNQQAKTTEVSSDDLFVRTFINKTDLFKGEPIIATIKIFTSVDLYGFEDIKFPSFDSFYAQDIESPEKLNFIRETYNNKTYNVAVLKKYILYPRVSGSLKIESCKIDCQVRQVSGASFWNPFGSYQLAKKSIQSPEIKINVKNLPSTSHNYFSGAVGNFKINLEKNLDTVNVNEALNIKLILSGTGNFNMIEPPKIIWPDEFEVYDPVISDNTSVTSAGISGSKTWEYTVVPRYPGLYKLSKINFAYFDLNSSQYKSQTLDNINFAVRKDKNDTKLHEYNYTQKNIEYIGNEDIRFIKTKSLIVKKDYTPLVLSSFFYLLYIIPIIIFGIIIIVLRKKIKENSDISKIKAKKANKISKKRLKKAKVYMQQQNKVEFYKEIISALWGYLGDKLSITVAELTKQKVEIALLHKNVEKNIIDQLIKIIEKCEFAHFAPTTTETELSYIYKEAVDIIETLEQKIR